MRVRNHSTCYLKSGISKKNISEYTCLYKIDCEKERFLRIFQGFFVKYYSVKSILIVFLETSKTLEYITSDNHFHAENIRSLKNSVFLAVYHWLKFYNSIDKN